MISIFDQMMNELAFSNFDIRNIEVHNLTFPNACVTDYSKLARKQHLLHLILSGSRKYNINGKEIKMFKLCKICGTCIAKDKNKYNYYYQIH